MKTLPMLVLVTLIPVAAASSANIGNTFGQDQILLITSEKAIANPELAKCRGTKCAGPGDTIRNQQGSEKTLGGPELAKCRGTKCAGPGDAIRNGQDMDAAQQLAGNRGGQSTSGTKKGARHHDGSRVMPALADNRGGQATSGTKKGPRHHDDLIENAA